MRRKLCVLLLLSLLLFVACNSESVDEMEPEQDPENIVQSNETDETDEQESEEGKQENTEKTIIYLEDLTSGENLNGLYINRVEKTEEDFYLEIDSDYTVDGVLEYDDYAGGVIYRVNSVKGIEKTIYGSFDYLDEDLAIEIPHSGMFSLTDEQHSVISNQLGVDIYDYLLENQTDKINFNANFTGYAVAGLIPGEILSNFNGSDIIIEKQIKDKSTSVYDAKAKEIKENSPYGNVVDFKDLSNGDLVNGLTISFLEANGLDRYISFSIDNSIYAEGILRYSHSKDSIVFIPLSKEDSEKDRTAIWITDGASKGEFIDIPYMGSMEVNQNDLDYIYQNQNIDVEKILTEDKDKQIETEAYIKGFYTNVENLELRFSTAGCYSMELNIKNPNDLIVKEPTKELQTKGLSYHEANQTVKVFEGTDSEALLHLDSANNVLINKETDFILDLDINDENNYFYTVEYKDIGLVKQYKSLVGIIDYGPSLDYTTRLYEIEYGMLKLLGTIPGKLVDTVEEKDYETVYMDSIGFEAPVKLYNLPNNVWFGRTTVAFLDYEFKPLSDTYMTDFEVTVLKDVTINNVSGDSVNLNKGDVLKYTQSAGSEYETSQIFVINSETKASIGTFYSKDLKREYFDGYHIFD